MLSVWSGDLGLDDGVPQNVYQLETDGMTQSVEEDGSPRRVEFHAEGGLSDFVTHLNATKKTEVHDGVIAFTKTIAREFARHGISANAVCPGPTDTPLLDVTVGSTARQSLWLLLGAVGVVLLIACANVANLFAVRAEGRVREMTVRRAIGASRLQLLDDDLHGRDPRRQDEPAVVAWRHPSKTLHIPASVGLECLLLEGGFQCVQAA